MEAALAQEQARSAAQQERQRALVARVQALETRAEDAAKARRGVRAIPQEPSEEFQTAFTTIRASLPAFGRTDAATFHCGLSRAQSRPAQASSLGDELAAELLALETSHRRQVEELRAEKRSLASEVRGWAREPSLLGRGKE